MIVTDSINRLGVIESLVQLFGFVVLHVISGIRIISFWFRGYDVAPGASVHFSADLYQYHRRGIHIGSGAQIRRNTRINAGYDGTIDIGKRVLIDEGTCVMAQHRIIIGEGTLIAPYCFIVDFNHNISGRQPIARQGYAGSQIRIGKNVWIGTHSIILPGVVIGDGAVIGAGSVVTGDVAPYSVAAGNPAKFIKHRS